MTELVVPEKQPLVDTRSEATVVKRPTRSMQEVFEILREIVQLVDPKEDVGSRVDFLMNPRNPLTSSILSVGQVRAQVFARSAAHGFPIMSVVRRDADTRLLATISLEGVGRRQAIATINMEDALRKLGLTGRLGDQKEEKSHWYSRGGKAKPPEEAMPPTASVT